MVKSAHQSPIYNPRKGGARKGAEPPALPLLLPQVISWSRNIKFRPYPRQHLPLPTFQTTSFSIPTKTSWAVLPFSTAATYSLLVSQTKCYQKACREGQIHFIFALTTAQNWINLSGDKMPFPLYVCKCYICKAKWSGCYLRVKVVWRSVSRIHDPMNLSAAFWLLIGSTILKGKKGQSGRRKQREELSQFMSLVVL